MQNENGPCPLIAIANVLLLRGKITIHPDMSHIDLDGLLDRVVNFMFENNPHTDDPDLESSRLKNLEDALAILPHLAEGMDVNPRFRHVSDLEFSPQLVVFDLLGINLRHAWLVDPDDTLAFAVVGSRSYNQLMERLVEGDSDDAFIRSFVHQVMRKVQGETVPLDLASELSVIQQFLDDTAAQITYFGLESLFESVQESEVCAFFRNNHFSTLTKHNGHLYALVTDIGYAEHPEIVWEEVVDLEGNSVFCDSAFRQVRLSSDDFLKHKKKKQQQQPKQQPPVDEVEDTDYRLALQMQQEEDALAAASMASSRATNVAGSQQHRQRQQQPTPAYGPSPGTRPDKQKKEKCLVM